MKIPKDAKRLFTGIIFDVYQWEQEQYDGSTATFEGLKRPDSVQVLATKGGKLLVAEEEQPAYGKFLGLFGGRIDEGESPLESAKRELLEETGLVSDDWELVRSYPFPSKTDAQVHFFVARDCRQEQEPEQEPGERIRVRELSLGEFYALLLDERFRAEMIALDLLRRKERGELAAFEQKVLPKGAPHG